MEKVTNKKTLAEFPELAAQWHPTKNGDLGPDQVIAGSHRKYWWQCSDGPDHEWEATLTNRNRGTGCPCCRGRQVSVTNSLAALHPNEAAQWHQTKNGGLTPDQVVAGSNRKYWWWCPEGPDHEWEAVVNNRTRGTGCPFCRGLQASVSNSLASRHPDIAVQWHPTKNKPLTAWKVTTGSNREVWWRCRAAPRREPRHSCPARPGPDTR